LGVYASITALFVALASVALAIGHPGLAAATFACGGFSVWLAILAQKTMRTAMESSAVRQSQIEQLHAELEGQRSAIDALADGLEIAVFICDSKANVRYANRRATVLFGFEAPQGRAILSVTLSHELEQLVLTAAREGTPQRAELNFRYPEERVGIAQAWRGESDRVFLSVYDISDLRRLERVRQDFVANVSHELRTPLTLIRAMAETLEDSPSQEVMGRYLRKIIEEVDRLSLISQDLLILSAAESNPVRKQSCDIAEVLRSVVAQLHQKATEKGLTLEYDGPTTLIIEANQAQMTQVAINLIDNAINYTAQGGIVMKVIPDEACIRIIVSDTGIGIASDHLPRIFERFYRVDKGRSRSTGGTGLGLSIVKHIVEAHGGSVSVESALNHGSTFSIRVPVG
jgi:two-component system, OmpR family, phosphate regulon sensor histidine kinase PhoR